MVASRQPSPLRAWGLLGGYVALVYGSLPWTRDVLIALSTRDLVGTLVTASYFVAVVAVVYHVVFDVRLNDRIAFAALVVLGSIVGALVLGLRIPEERLHFLQYGLMAVLARRALAAGSWLGPGRCYLAAVGIAGLVGWGDELLQGRLPDRVYDPSDVLVNVAAAALAMVGYEALHDQLGWRSRRPPPPTP